MRGRAGMGSIAMTYTYIENDGRYPAGSVVEVRYSRTTGSEPPAADATSAEIAQAILDSWIARKQWPWVRAVVNGQTGPEEWHVIVTAREYATLADGSSAPPGGGSSELVYPDFRVSAEEIRAPDSD